MLRFLSIQHLAVIESVELDFDAGLNILTGETGAGKSILVEAVGLLLGARASSDLVRTGEDVATIQAIFDAGGEEIIVRRELTSTGRSRAFVNGALATAGALRDLAYGDDPRQRYDVYLPAQPQHAPVILFVHGGGWANGNKDNPGVVENKAAYWLPKGYVLVSINYRMRPDTAPIDQGRDVARALADVQKRAPSWNADPATSGMVDLGGQVSVFGPAAPDRDAWTLGIRHPRDTRSIMGTITLTSGVWPSALGWAASFTGEE